MPRGIRSTDGNGNGNGHRWGAVIEVEVGTIPPPNRSPWTELYDELMLRLEQTGPKNALAVPVADKKIGAAATASLRKCFDRHPGRGSVNLAIREKSGQTFVYVWRGAGWPK